MFSGRWGFIGRQGSVSTLLMASLTRHSLAGTYPGPASGSWCRPRPFGHPRPSSPESCMGGPSKRSGPVRGIQVSRALQICSWSPWLLCPLCGAARVCIQGWWGGAWPPAASSPSADQPPRGVAGGRLSGAWSGLSSHIGDGDTASVRTEPGWGGQSRRCPQMAGVVLNEVPLAALLA